MADNVNITAGSGTVIATDQVGTDHYQRIKLTDGTADSSTPINVDIGAKANALRVVPANDITDATYIGDIKFGEAEPNSAAIKTAVELIDNAISGNEMQVDIVASLPAGTNTIGKLAANTGVDIGDVDILSIAAGDNNIGNVDIVTVPAPLNVVGTGTEAAALRVTIATDSTGVLSVDDNGGSLTVDGTVTANLSATDNAVLDTIDAVLDTINAKLVTGTVIGDVNLGATDNAVLDAIAASDASIDGKITACNTGAVVLAAGTAAIGKLAANDGVDIGNVDIASIAAGTNIIGKIRLVDSGGTEITETTDHSVNVTIVADDVGVGGGTQYTEDAAAAADPVGNAQICVRLDTPAGITSADGDNIARRATNYGAAYCQIVDSSGNFIDTFGGSGGTAAADDADFTAGTTQGTPAMGVYESSPTSVTDGDLGTVGITQTRSLKVQETNSTAILADTANMDTNLGSIAGAVSGSEMQVDLVSTNRANGVEAVTDWTAVAQNTVVESGTIDCSGHDATAINIQAFLDSTIAHTGTRFQIQVSYNTSGDEDWADYREFEALVGTANSEAITNNPLTAGSTTITMADTGGNYETAPMGRWLAIEDGTLANSELVLNTGYTADTSITILDGTTNEHAQNTLMYDIAMSKTVILDASVQRARVVVNNTCDVNGSTLNYKVRANKLTR